MVEQLEAWNALYDHLVDDLGWEPDAAVAKIDSLQQYAGDRPVTDVVADWRGLP